MITEYGYPPAWAECVEKPVPEGLLVKLGQTVVGANAVGMHPKIGKPASPVAVARQLNRCYPTYEDNSKVRVYVDNYGWFLLGSQGWSLQANREGSE